MQGLGAGNRRTGSYWVCILARNAAAHLADTLDSLLNQALPPLQIISVDDGSSDSTSKILRNYEKQHPVRVLTLPDHGYDIRRVPRNVNLAWRLARDTGLESDYFMISGDDCTYPIEYARVLISRMTSQPSLVVSSGRPGSGGNPSQEHSPSGAGRMIRCAFWKALGEEYPVRAGWETWLLYKAQEKGLKVKLFDDLQFEHVRSRGTMHQFAYWGAAMRSLGYHPLYGYGRIAKNVIERRTPAKASLAMLRGYGLDSRSLQDPFVSPFEESLREFVRAQQKLRIVRLAVSFLKGRSE